MKTNLTAVFLFFYMFSFPQNTLFLPYEALFQGTTTVTVKSFENNSTVYFTTDGSQPSLNSPSTTSEVQIPISVQTTFKGFYVRLGQTSPVETVTYYRNDYERPKLFFKPPASWTDTCAYMNAEEPRSMVDYFPPGPQMSSACEGWKKINANFAKGYVTFNTCYLFTPADPQSSPAFLIDSDLFWDFSVGAITDPPVCLLASNEVSGKNAMIKVFPNPVQDKLKINSQISFFKYEILDSSGKIFEAKKLSDNEINVSGLPGGVYFIKLYSAEGGNNYVRFVKK
ncbi:T9SS type A sorting domain-containing protein [Kaistella palustris]|uniref:T9SS type A sorting domain-containing protein n=1 Tax=Kaistella palustris TaxID=493376 RepID=UPI00041D931C|nr:T9SS type A sorting domain-containing protein [Kaistella palustris]